MTRKVWYEVDIEEHARIRHFHEVDGGKVVGFTVQLEVWHDNAWKVVVRYDGRHGFPHKDIYRKNGQSRKVPLDMSFGDALTAAERDIRERCMTYMERFLRGNWP